MLGAWENQDQQCCGQWATALQTIARAPLSEQLLVNKWNPASLPIASSRAGGGANHQLIMKNLILSLAALAALAIPLVAKEYKLPKEDSVFSVKFPDKWTVTHEDESVDALSPDEAVEIYAQTDDATTIEESVKASIEYLDGQGVKLDLETQKETDGEHNGMQTGSLVWKGTDKDGACTVSLLFIQVTEETTISVIYWATDEMVKKHEKDINGVLESMKSLVVKKGKKSKEKAEAEAEE